MKKRKKEESNAFETLKKIYDDELIENTISAFANMEKIGFISKRQLGDYKRMLRKMKN